MKFSVHKNDTISNIETGESMLVVVNTPGVKPLPTIIGIGLISAGVTVLVRTACKVGAEAYNRAAIETLDKLDLLR